MMFMIVTDDEYHDDGDDYYDVNGDIFNLFFSVCSHFLICFVTLFCTLRVY